MIPSETEFGMVSVGLRRSIKVKSINSIADVGFRSMGGVMRWCGKVRDFKFVHSFFSVLGRAGGRAGRLAGYNVFVWGSFI